MYLSVQVLSLSLLRYHAILTSSRGCARQQLVIDAERTSMRKQKSSLKTMSRS
jgi:hypothetical protein